MSQLLEKVRRLFPQFYPTVKCCLERRLYLEEVPQEKCYHELAIEVMERLIDQERLRELLEKDVEVAPILALIHLSLILVFKYFPKLECVSPEVLKVLQDRNIILINDLIVLECVE